MSAKLIPFPESSQVLWDRWMAARRAHEQCPCARHMEACVAALRAFYLRFVRAGEPRRCVPETVDEALARERLVLAQHREGDHVA